MDGVSRTGYAMPEAQTSPAKSSTPGRAFLEVRGISKQFGGLKAVDDFSMTLEQGKITALVGPNGCGKTTAFNLVTGFLKPDRGEIHFQGYNIAKFPPYRMPQIGIVRSWQDVRNFQAMTVLDNVLIAGQNQSGEHLLKVFFTPWRVKGEEKAECRESAVLP